jgi:hypothetical protein
MVIYDPGMKEQLDKARALFGVFDENDEKLLCGFLKKVVGSFLQDDYKLLIVFKESRCANMVQSVSFENRNGRETKLSTKKFFNRSEKFIRERLDALLIFFADYVSRNCRIILKKGSKEKDITLLHLGDQECFKKNGGGDCE